MLSAGQRNHGEAVRKRREMLFEFVRRATGGNEVNFVKIKAAVGRAGDGQVPIVDGVERSAKNADAARVVLGCGAVGLRGGQCCSEINIAGVMAGR
jgi:hypothetical protein